MLGLSEGTVKPYALTKGRFGKTHNCVYTVTRSGNVSRRYADRTDFGEYRRQISGFDFSEELDEVTADRLRAAFSKYRLLLILDRVLSAENQARFANIFGDA